MISENSFHLVIICLNLLPILIAALSLKKWVNTLANNLFLATLVLGIVWQNSLLLLWREGVLALHAIWLAKTVFCSGILVIALFTTFLFALVKKRSFVSVIVFVNATLLAILAVGTDLIIKEVIVENGKISKLLYGGLHLYFVLSFIISGVVAFAFNWFAFKGSNDEIIKYQLRIILISGVMTFIAIAISNAIIPYIFGKTIIPIFGPLFSILFLGNVARLFYHGEENYLSNRFSKLLKAFLKNDFGHNFISLNQLALLLESSLETAVSNVNQSLTLKTGKTFFRLDLKNVDAHVENKEKSNLTGLAKGFWQQLFSLERDNKRLFFSLLNAEEAFKKKYLPDLEIQPGGLLLNLPSAPLREVNEIIKDNRADMKKLTGVEFICISADSMAAVQKTLQLSTIHKPILFSGETDTGRSLLARIALKQMSTIEPVEIFFDIESFETDLAEALILAKSSPILIHDVDILPRHKLVILEKFLRRQNTGCVCLTVSKNFSLAKADHSEFFCELFEREVIIKDLKQRPEDRIFLTLAEIVKYENVYFDESFSKINLSSVKTVLKKEEVTTISQIIKLVAGSCLISRAPVFELQRPKQLLDNSTASLSALEIAEKEVIKEYIIKNRKNKNKTARELKITINTLNSKLNKYKLQYLF